MAEINENLARNNGLELLRQEQSEALKEGTINLDEGSKSISKKLTAIGNKIKEAFQRSNSSLANAWARIKRDKEGGKESVKLKNKAYHESDLKKEVTEAALKEMLTKFSEGEIDAEALYNQISNQDVLSSSAFQIKFLGLLETIPSKKAKGFIAYMVIQDEKKVTNLNSPLRSAAPSAVLFTKCIEEEGHLREITSLIVKEAKANKEIGKTQANYQKERWKQNNIQPTLKELCPDIKDNVDSAVVKILKQTNNSDTFLTKTEKESAKGFLKTEMLGCWNRIIEKYIGNGNEAIAKQFALNNVLVRSLGPSLIKESLEGKNTSKAETDTRMILGNAFMQGAKIESGQYTPFSAASEALREQLIILRDKMFS